MLLRTLVGLGGGACVFLAASVGHAQCTKDTDCKGERVCENGACVTPALPPPPAAPEGATPGNAPAPGAATPGAQPPATPTEGALANAISGQPGTTSAAVPLSEAPAVEEPPRKQRHSTGMMVGGIIMVSISPIALLAAAIANAEQTVCESDGYYFDGTSGTVTSGSRTDCDDYDATIYGGVIIGLGLAGAGIPMIVIGGKKEPVASATITPWATARAAGIGLRIEM